MAIITHVMLDAQTRITVTRKRHFVVAVEEVGGPDEGWHENGEPLIIHASTGKAARVGAVIAALGAVASADVPENDIEQTVEV